MKTMIAILAATLLCSYANATDPWPRHTPANLGNLPANYKAVALAAVKRNLRDPDSVRTLHLAPMAPQPGLGGKTNVFVVVNAKNGFGGYTGNTFVVVAFSGGRVTEVFSL